MIMMMSRAAVDEEENVRRWIPTGGGGGGDALRSKLNIRNSSEKGPHQRLSLSIITSERWHNLVLEKIRITSILQDNLREKQVLGKMLKKVRSCGCCGSKFQYHLLLCKRSTACPRLTSPTASQSQGNSSREVGKLVARSWTRGNGGRSLMFEYEIRVRVRGV